METVIDARSTRFPAVGRALAAIADGRLYRLAGYPSFASYVEGQWGVSRAYAYRQIDAAKLMHELELAGAIVLPANEAQARALRQTGGTIEELVALLHGLPADGKITAQALFRLRRGRATSPDAPSHAPIQARMATAPLRDAE